MKKSQTDHYLQKEKKDKRKKLKKDLIKLYHGQNIENKSSKYGNWSGSDITS